jgi:hypothetical protein
LVHLLRYAIEARNTSRSLMGAARAGCCVPRTTAHIDGRNATHPNTRIEPDDRAFCSTSPATPIARHVGRFHVSDLSPSIDPAVLGQIEPRDKTRNLAAVALKALCEQGLAVAHACRQIHGDQSLGEAERHRRANKASADLIMAALPAVEKARGAIEKELAGLHEKLDRPVVEFSDVRAIEIRSKISGLPAAKRSAAVVKSIEKGGDDIAAAVLNADRLMSDFLTDVEEAEVRKL